MGMGRGDEARVEHTGDAHIVGVDGGAGARTGRGLVRDAPSGHLHRARVRVVQLDGELVPGDRLELAREVLDALREAAQLYRHRLLAARDVELQLYRRFQPAQHFLRAFGEGLHLSLGQIHLHGLQGK